MWMGFQDDWGFRWSPTRTSLLDAAAGSGVTVIRTTVYWSKVAPRRPRHPSNSFDPAYRLDDLDQLARDAQQRGIEVLLTIWGTPAWANGGAGENRLPRRMSDLTAFTHALAARYSGQHHGYPFVRFYSIWNEPNLAQFLSPQFAPDGSSLAPELYARAFRAAAAGIRSGSPDALVAAGETAHRGLDGPARLDFQASHSPARFAELVSQSWPRIRFDAWAHHPYPLDPQQEPGEQGAWPQVTIPQLGEFRAALGDWFDQPDLPLWVTEYGYQTEPAPGGVPPVAQARYLQTALEIVRADPNVRMFVWFVLRDREDMSWKGGLVTENGAARPGLRSFSSAARKVDARNPVVVVLTDRPNPRVVVPVVRLRAYDPPGTRLGAVYRVYRGRRLVAVGTPEVALRREGRIRLKLRFWPTPGRRYVVRLRVEDVHGNVVRSRVVLVPLGRQPPMLAGRLFSAVDALLR
jgi:cellulase (glycosyl hydrolase family 5)